ncbi:MAG TPA: L-serine ammonia-lyase, iron-sulfur-dependent, subunit alpha [Anaerolineaceae bacterium]
MESLKNLYRIGHGPSSSHTMGPRRAAEFFRAQQPQAAAYRVTLYGSLAATGRGHMTDKTLVEALSPKPVSILWEAETELPYHPNGMRFEALAEDGSSQAEWVVFSVGGGALQSEGQELNEPQVYPLTTMKDILKYCTQTGLSFWEYVEQNEGQSIWEHLEQVQQVMFAAIERGLRAEGVLPGGLGLGRKAWTIYRKTQLGGSGVLQKGYLAAYALAVAEENATGGLIVTAPTCGSCGVLPATIRHIQDHLLCPPESILRALATAGLIGNLVKTNGSISGAEVGCQGEIGTACAMAAAAATQLMGGTIRQIEYAAEMGLEHHLGLTCDPVDGLVQIPCIERNVFAAARAVDSAIYAMFSDGSHRVSLDEVISVMQQTGTDLPSLYRETASGGLAKAYRYPPQRPIQR